MNAQGKVKYRYNRVVTGYWLRMGRQGPEEERERDLSEETS